MISLKIFLFVVLSSLLWINSYSQAPYFTPTQINTINVTKAAYEGDLYLDTINKDYYIGLTNGQIAKIGDTLDEKIDTVMLIGDSIVIVEGNDSVYLDINDNDWDINTNGTGLEAAPAGNNTASGLHAIAIGNNSTASGNYSSVLGGQNNTASGVNSSVLNGTSNFATGDNSISGGAGNTASGFASFVFGGNSNSVSGLGSGVFSGNTNTISGFRSVILGGVSNQVSGFQGGILAGQENGVLGDQGAVIGGFGDTSYSYAEVVLGTYNTVYTPTNAIGINSTDKLLVVGNGTSNAARSNALTLLKDGRLGIGVDGNTNQTATLHIRPQTSIDPLRIEQMNVANANDSTVLVIDPTNGTVRYLDIDSLKKQTDDEDWFKIGTNSSPGSINDDIYTNGEVMLTNFPETRGDDTTARLNDLYTDINGNIKSGRREIIPPTVALNVTTITSTPSTFNYYNHYATQLTNAGLTPIPLNKLDFYVFYFDTAVFANVSINSLGVLTYDVISAIPSKHQVIDVRFFTK